MNINYKFLKIMEQVNNDIQKLHQLRDEYIKIHKRLKTYKIIKTNKQKNSNLIFKHMMDFYEISNITQNEKNLIYSVNEKNLIYSVKSKNCFNLEIPVKYKHLNPLPFTFNNFPKLGIINPKWNDYIDLENTFLHRGAFLLSNNKIYLEKFMGTPEVYTDLKTFISKRYYERIKSCREFDDLYFSCKSCIKPDNKQNKIETFYEILAYEIAKSKKLNTGCCKLSDDYSAILIQKKVLVWLYSAPNGPMFKKDVTKLQYDGYLLT